MVAQAPPPSEYNYERNSERESSRIMRENNVCCAFRPVRFGMTLDDVWKAPPDTLLLMGLCPTLWATTISVFFPWTTEVLWGQGGQWSWPRAGNREHFPSWPNILRRGSVAKGVGGITCMLGTTRCLESSVLLSMRLLQSSRSKVLQEKVSEQSGRSSSSTWPGSFIHRG